MCDTVNAMFEISPIQLCYNILSIQNANQEYSPQRVTHPTGPRSFSSATFASSVIIYAGRRSIT